MNTKLVILGLSGVALALAACGGGSQKGGNNAGQTDIPSLPAFPTAAEKSAAASPTTTSSSESTDPATVCKSAEPVPDAKKAQLDDLGKDGAGFFETGARNAKDKYTMADLQALEKRGEWREIVQHADDVAPAARNATWDKLLEKAAIEVLPGKTAGAITYESAWIAEALVQQHPVLSKSNAFMAKRTEAAKASGEQCLSAAWSGDHCLDRMREFLQVPNTAAESGFELAKVVRRNQFAYVAVPFFRWAIDKKSKSQSTFCKDSDLQQAIVAGLGLPPDYDNAQGARAIASGDCFDSLVSAVKKGFADGKSSYYRDNACAVLKAKNAL